MEIKEGENLKRWQLIFEDLELTGNEQEMMAKVKEWVMTTEEDIVEERCMHLPDEIQEDIGVKSLGHRKFGARKVAPTMARQVFEEMFPTEDDWFVSRVDRLKREKIIEEHPALQGCPKKVKSFAPSMIMGVPPYKIEKEKTLKFLQTLVLEESFPIQHLAKYLWDNHPDDYQKWGAMIAAANELNINIGSTINWMRLENIVGPSAKDIEEAELEANHMLSKDDMTILNENKRVKDNIARVSNFSERRPHQRPRGSFRDFRRGRGSFQRGSFQRGSPRGRGSFRDFKRRDHGANQGAFQQEGST